MPSLSEMIGTGKPPAPTAPTDPGPLTSIEDTDAMRNGIFDRVKGAVEKRFPVENERFKIELTNVGYKNNKPFSKNAQKEALLKQQSLHWKLYGNWRMTDKTTGQVVDEQKNALIAHVPYMTERGTFVRNGNEYTLSSQSRLKPGIYSRRKANGELATHFNILEGGRSFHVVMDPETAKFTVEVGGSKMKLAPILRAMGVTPEQLQGAWGNEIANKNNADDDSAKRAMKQFYRGTDENVKLSEAFAKMRLDPEVTQQTLGKAYDSVSPAAMLHASQKLLSISRGAEREDDRDALHYQHLMFPDDLMAERIEKDWDRRVQGKLLWTSSRRGKLAVNSGHLTPQIDAVFTKSGLASPIEEVNPLEVMDQRYRVMRTGEGGISESGVPDESRSVQPSHFGMVDPLRSPECYDPATEVFTINGWIPWPSVTDKTELACLVNGRIEFHVPFSLTRSEYAGDMYGLKTDNADYLVTPNHRMWARCGDHECHEFRFMPASEVHMKNRRFVTGGVKPWDGKYRDEYFELPEIEVIGNATKVFAPIPMIAWSAFMGWYLGEGCVVCDEKRKRYVTEITQTKPAFLPEIRRMLHAAFGADLKCGYSGKGFTIGGKQLALYLKQFGYCYDKYIPDYLLHGSEPVRRALFDALLMGEGRDMRKPGNVHQDFRATSKRLAEGFQFLAISLGYSTSIHFQPDKRPWAHGTWDVMIHKSTELGTPQTVAARSKAFYVQKYTGMVYCATVPGGLLYVRRNRGHAHWSGNSLKIGIDSRFTVNAFRGKDGIYTKLMNPKGQITPVHVREAVNSVVAFPGEMARQGTKVRAMVHGRLEYVDRAKVNYEMIHPSHMFTVGTNLVPMISGTSGQRVSMGSRFISQALAMKDPEAPFVQALSDDGKHSFEELYGTKAAAAVRADVGGRVSKVTKDAIVLDTPAGEKRYELYNNFAYNRKSMLHNTPVVQPGQHVAPGALLARSNFTDANGTLGIGKNLRVAFMPWKGLNYEDAYVISKSAADKLTSEHLYPVKVDFDTHTTRGTKEYISLFPTKFNQDQLKLLGDDGVVKVGQTVKSGDPLVLAVRERPQTDIHRGRKPGWGDASETWDHESDGIVTDVEHTKNGVRVHVKTYKPMQEADKIAVRFGGKGVVSRIIPDEQMPHDAKGNVMDVLVNPLGVVTRQNPAQLVETVLSKISEKTGKPYKMPAFLPTGTSLIDFALAEAKKYGVSDTEELTDPATGRTFKGILTGRQHFMKLHFLAEKKKGMRDTGGYTSENMPARGGPEGCFIATQDIATSNGPAHIGHIVEKKQGVQVLTFDEQAGDWCYRPVTDWFVYRAPVSNILAIDFCRGDGHSVTMYPTKNHMVYKYDGSSVLAGELAAGDELVGIGASPTKAQMDLCLGSMLGDAAFTNNAVSIEHSVKQTCWIDWKLRMLSGLCPCVYDKVHEPNSLVNTRRKSRRIDVRNSQLSSCIDNWCMQYGKKAVLPSWLNNIGELGLSVWALDDGAIGNRSKKKGKTRLDGAIATHGFSESEVKTLIGWLNSNFDIQATTRISESTGKKYFIVGLPATACTKLARIIAKNIPYTAIPKSKRWLRKFAMEQQRTVPVAQHDIINRLTRVPLIVKSVRQYVPPKDVSEVNVYDITVDHTHKYMASGALVSNSKKLGVWDINALLSHGATEILKDAKTIRGQKNEEFWKAFQMGHTPPSPEVPMIYKKFMAYMAGSGINVKRSGSKLNIMAMTDADIDKLSRGEIKEPKGVNADTMQEIPGGLFDKGLTGGHNGQNWTHIKLDEPMPNPIMEEPILKMLGLTEKAFEDIMAGRERLNGRVGGEAIKEALARINVPELKRKSQELVQSGAKSRRSNAIKMLRYVDMMEKRGLKPTDFVLNKVPVLPPLFRPISATSDFVIKSDANSLYVDMMKHNEALRDVKKELGHEQAGDERLNLYKSFRALTGLGDSINPKLHSQGVNGLLRHVFGPRSPKIGMFQYRVLGGTLDQAGLAVVTPNPSMDMDHVGLPEDHAWTLYKKFVVRKLVQRGMRPTDAIKSIADKTPQALATLTEEMAHRPMIVNRAPTLHKYNLMAFYPQLVKGHTLNVSPLVTAGFGMDFDGDTALMHIPVSDKAVEEAKTKMLPSRNLFAIRDFDVHYLPSQEYAYGLFLASSKKKAGEARAYADVKAAIAAYKKGEIDADDRIRVRSTIH